MDCSQSQNLASSALVIDTGLGPATGAHILALARKLAGPRKLCLTVTHFYPELGFGAQAIEKQATIIYNRAQRDALEEKGAMYIDFYKQT